MSDLGTLPTGNFSIALGINDNGYIIGYAKIASNADHAFLSVGGLMTDLGTLGGRNSYPTGINNNGQIVGYADTASGEQHAFLYTPNPVPIPSTVLLLGSGLLGLAGWRKLS